MSLFGHAASFTSGAGAFFGGCHAHQSFAASHVSGFFVTLRRALARIGRAHLHPLLEVLDHLVRQLAARLLRRHREILVCVADRLDEQAFLRDRPAPPPAPLSPPRAESLRACRARARP